MLLQYFIKIKSHPTGYVGNILVLKEWLFSYTFTVHESYI